MNAPERLPATPAFMAETHEVINVSRDLVDFNAFEQDTALQAAVLVQHALVFVAEAFCASRLEAAGRHNYGALPRGTDFAAIIERATRRVGAG